MMSLSRCKYVMFSRFPRVNVSWGRGGEVLNAGSVRSGRGTGGTRTWSGRPGSTVGLKIIFPRLNHT